MWPDRVSIPGPLTYESVALPTALRGPAPTALSRPAPTELPGSWVYTSVREVKRGC